MSLSAGHELLLTPGPTTIPGDVRTALSRPAIDVYSPDIATLTNAIVADMKTLFRTRGDVYLYAANGHGAWEAAITNTFSKGDHALILEAGLFASGWGEMAQSLGLNVETLPGSWDRAVNPDKLRARLEQDRNHSIKAVLLTHVDTASSILNDLQAVRRAIDAAGHPALLMVDVIASLGAIPFDMDGWKVDVAVGASQKALMMTPGLSFVAASSKAKTAHQSAGLRTRYWDWTLRDGSENYRKFCGTCPEHLVFGMHKALEMLNAEGTDNVHRRHRLLAGASRAAVEAWSERGHLSFNVVNAADRADSVTVILMEDGAARLIEFCKSVCGLVLGVNIGAIAGRGFRIGHMGYINAPSILGALSSIETGLKVLGIPHGNGVQAAIDHLARNLSPSVE